MMDETFIIMNLDYVLELGEGQFIEFKESLDRNFAKEIVAFANASGGVVYLGISDTGKIKGIDISNKLKSKIQDIAYNCDPLIIISLTVINNILAVEIREGKNKPYSCSSGFYMRMGANSQKMKRDEILTLAIKSGKIRFDEQICPNFDWKDFDNDKFEYYLKLAKISDKLPKDEILKNLRVLTDDGFTNAGVLYFAKKPYKYIISSRIRCVHFKGDGRIDILDKKVIDRGIIGNIEFAIEYLQERVPVRYEIKKLARDEFPEYPIEAYREAVVNAIIHFDYFLGDMIAVEKHKSSIIINNKGELLFPEKDFGKKSEARNRLLVDLLARTEFMEKAGTGIRRMRDACKNNGNKILFDFSDSYWTIIKTNGDVVDGGASGGASGGVNNLYKFIQIHPHLNAKELSGKLGISLRTTQRWIKQLKDEGKITFKGAAKTGGYFEK